VHPDLHGHRIAGRVRACTHRSGRASGACEHAPYRCGVAAQINRQRLGRVVTGSGAMKRPNGWLNLSDFRHSLPLEGVQAGPESAILWKFNFLAFEMIVRIVMVF
jgi:hypothetical protein